MIQNQQVKNYSFQIQPQNKSIRIENQRVLSPNPILKTTMLKEQNKIASQNPISPNGQQKKIIVQNLVIKSNSQKDQNQVSWTKHIALEFKVEELDKKINSQQLEIKAKTQKIKTLEKIIIAQNEKQKQMIDLQNKLKLQQLQIKGKVQRIESLQKLLIDARDKQKREVEATQKKYQHYMADQKAKYIEQTKNKDIYINSLLQKIVDESKKSLSSEINQYILQTLSKNNDLEGLLVGERQKNQNMVNKLKQFQQKQKVYELNRQKQIKLLDQMAAQLNFVVNKVSMRNLYNTQNQCFTLLMKSQSAQIEKLRTSYDELQSQFLRYREFTTQASNKLLISLNQQKLQHSKQKYNLNSLISDFGTKLTIKQNQYNTLKIKLSNIQRKYNNILQQHKTKFQNMHHLLSRKQITLQHLQQIKTAISNMNLSECANCMQNQKQLENSRQKLRVFVN